MIIILNLLDHVFFNDIKHEDDVLQHCVSDIHGGCTHDFHWGGGEGGKV